MLALQSGDEYTMFFGVSNARTKIRDIGKNLNLPLTLIGSVREIKENFRAAKY